MSADQRSRLPDAPAVVALGSNLGDSCRLIRSAMDCLQALSREPIVRSSLWRSAPIDCPANSPDFINAVVLLTPDQEETPQSLLGKLQALERQFGRQPKQVVNEPRPLDLDLIAFGNLTCRSEQLTLPHPRAHERKFVLAPLAEIAPDLVLPGQTESVEVLLRCLRSTESVERLH